MSLNEVVNSQIFNSAVASVLGGTNPIPTLNVTTLNATSVNVSNEIASISLTTPLINVSNGSHGSILEILTPNHATALFPNAGLGMQIAYNTVGGLNECDFINLAGSNGTFGGFNFYKVTQTSAGALLASIYYDQGLVLTTNAPNITQPSTGTINNVLLNCQTGGANTVVLGPIQAGGGLGTLTYDPTSQEVTFNVSSIRYKENVVPIQDTSTLYQLVPISYTEKRTKLKQHGFIAEMACQADEFFVFRNKDGDVDGINEKAIIASLVNELQILRKRVDRLDPKNALPSKLPIPIIQTVDDIPIGINPEKPVKESVSETAPVLDPVSETAPELEPEPVV